MRFREQKYLHIISQRNTQFLNLKKKYLQIKADLKVEHLEFVWKRGKSYKQNPA